MSIFSRHQPEETKPEQVKCAECKHYVDITDAQLVQVQAEYPGFITRFSSTYYDFYNTFYCQMHRLSYDRINMDGTKFKLVPAVPEHYYADGEC